MAEIDKAMQENCAVLIANDTIVVALVGALVGANVFTTTTGANALQLEAAMAPGGDVLPALQLVQTDVDVAPTVAENLPAVQLVQGVAYPPVPYFPAAQDWHASLAK